MFKTKRYSVLMECRDYYTGIITVEAEDKDSAHDAALEMVRGSETIPPTFKFIERRYEVGTVLDAVA